LITGTVLDRIADATRRRVERAMAEVSIDELSELLAETPERRPFAAALRSEGISIIAEIKRASPSAGVIAPEIDPADTAAEYRDHGARAISVLTEPDFFGGDIAHLKAVRRRVDLPLLMKDFFIDDYQVAQARVAGADCVLLIVALLGPRELRRMLDAADNYGVEALVEVHNEAEMEDATAAGALLVGVNNRNLKTLDVDLEVSRRLAPMAAEMGERGQTLVCESGLRRRDQLEEMAALGFDAFLVGTHLVASRRPGEALSDLLDQRTN